MGESEVARRKRCGCDRLAENDFDGGVERDFSCTGSRSDHHEVWRRRVELHRWDFVDAWRRRCERAPRADGHPIRSKVNNVDRRSGDEAGDAEASCAVRLRFDRSLGNDASTRRGSAELGFDISTDGCEARKLDGDVLRNGAAIDSRGRSPRESPDDRRRINRHVLVELEPTGHHGSRCVGIAGKVSASAIDADTDALHRLSRVAIDHVHVDASIGRKHEVILPVLACIELP